MAEKKLHELTAVTSLAATDLLYVERDPSGSPLDRKIEASNLFKEISLLDLSTSNGLTIAAGSITPTQSWLRVDTEASAATDDLDTIVSTNFSDGGVIFFRANNTARTVVVKHNTGNIVTPNGLDINLDDDSDLAIGIYDATLVKWLVISLGNKFPSGLSSYSATGGASGGASVLMRSSNGTVNAPTASVTADRIGLFAMGGVSTGTTYAFTAAAEAYIKAVAAVGAANLPTYMTLSTTPEGSTTRVEALRITTLGHPRWNLSEKRVTSQFDKTDQTPADITGLTFNAEAAGVYKIRAVIYTTSNVAGGIQFELSGTATYTSLTGDVVVSQTGAVVAPTASRVTAKDTAFANVTAVTAATVVLEALVVVNAVGTITLQFARNAAVGTSSVLVNSHMEIKDYA